MFFGLTDERQQYVLAVVNCRTPDGGESEMNHDGGITRMSRGTGCWIGLGYLRALQGHLCPAGRPSIWVDDVFRDIFGHATHRAVVLPGQP